MYTLALIETIALPYLRVCAKGGTKPAECHRPASRRVKILLKCGLVGAVCIIVYAIYS